jgi:ABC-type antimicrobial peptide transport system permease subunit
MNDLRFAFRQLAKNPGFTAVAALTLALCLGANLAIFAVPDSVLLRPLPFPEADRLVTLFNTYPKAGVERTGASLPNYYERRGNVPAFSHVSMLRYDTAIVGEAGSTEQEQVLRVSPEFFITLQKIVRGLDPELPVDDIRSMDVRISDSLIARRSPTMLTGIFAGVALLLAAIGTYGVLAFAVSQRRHEIGLRMALGARPKQIRHQFLSLGLRLLAAGTILGVVGAWLAGRAMQGVLFGVPTLPVATLLGASVIMTVVSLLASWLPVRRAAKVDPMEALRYE